MALCARFARLEPLSNKNARCLPLSATLGPLPHRHVRPSVSPSPGAGMLPQGTSRQQHAGGMVVGSITFVSSPPRRPVLSSAQCEHQNRGVSHGLRPRKHRCRNLTALSLYGAARIRSSQMRRTLCVWEGDHHSVRRRAGSKAGRMTCTLCHHCTCPPRWHPRLPSIARDAHAELFIPAPRPGVCHAVLQRERVASPRSGRPG